MTTITVTICTTKPEVTAGISAQWRVSRPPMPMSSAIVICTLSTQLRFHSGSSSALAKRKTSRPSTDSLPR